MREAETDKAVQLLDLVLEFFEDGANWIRGCFDDGHGRRCLAGAVQDLGCEHRLPIRAVLTFLQEATPNGRFPPVYFNDWVCSDVAELRSLIVKARALALREAEERPERERAAEVVKRWLLAEVERELAGRAKASEKTMRQAVCPPAPERIAA